MKITFIKWIFFIFVISQCAIYSCEPETNENQLPICNITNPEDGDTIDINSTVILSVDAYDNDGFIESVMIFINEKGYQFTDNFPIQLELSKTDIETDSCRIQAIAIDNQNGIAKDSATIWFKETSPIEGLPVKDISGIIAKNMVLSRDTIWHIVGNCLVETGVELLIEPGTLISFAPNQIDSNSGFRIDIKGKLVARGTHDDRIIFSPDDINDGSWGALVFYGQSEDWDTSSNTGSIVEYCEFFNGSYGSINIPGSGSVLATITIIDSYPLINNNIFHNSHPFDLWITASGSTKNALIYNNLFTGIIVSRSNLLFKGNIIDGASIELSSSQISIVEGNLFKNHNRDDYGIITNWSDMSNTQIINNEFSNNVKCIGIVEVTKSGTIRQNNFENSQFAIFLARTTIDIDASYNYWGTQDSISIGNYIYDFYDDYTLGKVSYANFSEEKYK